MEKYTFEQLPLAVGKIEDKLDSIEKLLLDVRSPNPPIDEMLTIEEAATLLHLAVPTIYSKVSRKEIPVSKKGKRLYFSHKELIAWIQSGRRKTPNEVARDARRLLKRN